MLMNCRRCVGTGVTDLQVEEETWGGDKRILFTTERENWGVMLSVGRSFEILELGWAILASLALSPARMHSSGQR